MSGHILKKEVQRESGPNPLDQLSTSFFPGGHDYREQNGHQKSEPASVHDLEKISQEVG